MNRITPEITDIWPCDFIIDDEDATGIVCELLSIASRVFFIPGPILERVNKVVLPVLEDVKSGKLTYDEGKELLNYEKLFSKEELEECNSNIEKHRDLMKVSARETLADVNN